MLQAAVDELYSSPMAEFTARRKALAAAARKSGERETAGTIAGLRKPTVSADTLNRLVRVAPDEVGELLDLGAELRAAEKALDGPALRELSTKRRHLVGELANLAFEITDQQSPSAAVRDEVTATLNAALADEQVAERLLSGALVTQARWDGFGSTSLPELAAVLPMDPARRSRAARAESDSEAAATPSKRPPKLSPMSRPAVPEPRRANETAAATATDSAARRRQEQAERVAAEAAAARVQVEAEQRRRVEAARLEATAAADAAASARQTLVAIDRRISELSLQLAQQRRLLAEAQRQVRGAESREKAAQLALTRAGGSK